MGSNFTLTKKEQNTTKNNIFPTKSIEMVVFKVNLLIYNYLPFLNADVGIHAKFECQRLNLVARKGEMLTKPVQK